MGPQVVQRQVRESSWMTVQGNARALGWVIMRGYVRMSGGVVQGTEPNDWTGERSSEVFWRIFGWGHRAKWANRWRRMRALGGTYEQARACEGAYPNEWTGEGMQGRYAEWANMQGHVKAPSRMSEWVRASRWTTERARVCEVVYLNELRVFSWTSQGWTTCWIVQWWKRCDGWKYPWALRTVVWAVQTMQSDLHDLKIFHQGKLGFPTKTIELNILWSIDIVGHTHISGSFPSRFIIHCAYMWNIIMMNDVRMFLLC